MHQNKSQRHTALYPTLQNQRFIALVPCRFGILRKMLLLCFVFLLIGCGNKRSGPGYSMLLPEVSPTPAPVQQIATMHEEKVTNSLAAQTPDDLVAAATVEGQPVFVVLAQSGLWMGILEPNASYSWSRPQGLPELLTTNEISALNIYENELWVGTRNHGLFRYALTPDNREWRNETVENSQLPSNTINRFAHRITHGWIMTANGIASPRDDGEEWTIFNTEDGLLDNNTLDIGSWAVYAGGAAVIATESGLVTSVGGSEFNRLSGGTRCHFEHASQIYNVSGKAWVFIDQKDPASSTGWRVAGICQGSDGLMFGTQWDPIILDGAAYPNPRIATHYQDQNDRVWIAFSADPSHPQGVIAHYSGSFQNEKWTRYQLPAGMPVIGDGVVMLLVGNDLWVEKSGETTFIVLEDILEDDQAKG